MFLRVLRPRPRQLIDHAIELNTVSGGYLTAKIRLFNVIREVPEVAGDVQKDILNPSSWIVANRRLLKRIQDTEDDIEEHGAVASMFRPWVQRGLLLAGVGNEKVYLGKEPWLFYRQDVDSVSGPGFLDELQSV